MYSTNLISQQNGGRLALTTRMPGCGFYIGYNNFIWTNQITKYHLVVPGTGLEGREFGGRKELIAGIELRTLLSGDGVGEVVVKLGL